MQNDESPIANHESRLHLFYGGTFDPFHNGHLAIACAARDELGVEVRLMPAADPPHRAPPGASAAQRAAMLDLAVADEAGLRVDRRELHRAERDPETSSWTIDTLREVRGELGPAAPVALLVGADSFISLPTWREWEALFGLTHFVVAERPGNLLDGELPDALAGEVRGRWAGSPAELESSPAGRVCRLRQPLHPESATDIRRRIAADRPWRELVPPAVAAFIDRNGLYRRPAL